MGFDVNKRADVFMTVEADAKPQHMDSPVTRDAIGQQKTVAYLSEYAAESARMASPERDGLFTDLMMLEEPRWFRGLWGNVEGGWKDSRTGEFFSFHQMRSLVDARIKELDLSPELIAAWHQSTCSVENDKSFWRGTLESRLARFKNV